jgi:uncharacterized protein
MPPKPTIQDRYKNALDTFIARAKADPYIVAVVLCGSLSHDTVWEKSDIDLVVIVKDGDKPAHGNAPDSRSFALVEDTINFHVIIETRSQFRRSLQGAIQNSFLHSLLAKGQLVFTRDSTLQNLFDDARTLGSRDQQIQTLQAASTATACLYKAQKWLKIKNDPAYSFVWITMTALYLAKMEVIADGQVCGREAIQQALAINPDFFNVIYTNLIHVKKTPKNIAAALDAIDDYLSRRIRTAFGPILEYLKDAGAPRSATELATHFSNQLGTGDVTTACEWLSDKDIIRKVSTPVRLTIKSPTAFEELAFYYDGTP